MLNLLAALFLISLPLAHAGLVADALQTNQTLNSAQSQELLLYGNTAEFTDPKCPYAVFDSNEFKAASSFGYMIRSIELKLVGAKKVQLAVVGMDPHFDSTGGMLPDRIIGTVTCTLK
jgi:hypothetical protein